MVLTQKQLALTLFLVLALLPLAMAEETVVSNTTYTSGSSIDLEKGDYTVNVGAGNITTMQLVGSVTNESYLISEGDCKKLGSERLCYEEKIDNHVRLSVFNLAAQVELTLELNETDTFSVGDLFTATIWMNNSGENTAENMRMHMALPENLSINEIDECSYNNTNIYWSGEIRHDADEECIIEFRVDGAMDATLEAIVNYTSFGTMYTDESDDYNLDAKDPFDFTITVSSTTDLEPGQPFVISFEILIDDEDVNLSLKPFALIYDEGLRFTLTDIAYAHINEGEVYVNKEVNHEENFTGKFKLVPTRIGSKGEFKIGFTYNTTEDGTLRTFYKTYPYNTIELPLIIGTEPKDLTLESFTQGNINITVTNPYKYLTFKGYDADISFTLDNQRVRQRVPYYSSRVVATVPYIIPDLTNHRREKLAVGITAKTDAGDTVQAEQEFEVMLTPLQNIVIEKLVNLRSANNTATIVDVYATNEHQESVTVDFKEVIPEGLFVRGEIELTKTLQPGERVKIYSYELLSTGELPAEASTTTTYSYTYLDNYIEREETVAITASTYTPPAVISLEENETNQTMVAPERVKRQQPSIVHVIIAASVLFIFVIIIVIWEWMKHIHTFRIKHKSLLKQYQTLIGESTQLRNRKQELTEEQRLMSKKLDIVERHLEGYDKHLPEKIDDLEKRKHDVKIMEAVLKERHEHLKQRIGTLKEKEHAIIAYEHNFDELVKRIEGRESNLKQDDELLHKDIGSLTQDQSSITQQLDNNLKQQQLMQDRIKHFKAKNAANLNSKITFLARRKKQVMDYHKQLEREEEMIKNEFEKMQQDLEISKDDLGRAEKLYKQATVQLKKGEHEKQQDAHEEKRTD